MATKPAAAVTWATDLTYTSGSDTGLSPRAAIPAGVRSQGWVGGTPAPARFGNTLYGELADFSVWVFAGEAGYTVDAHIVETDAQGVGTSFAYQTDTTGSTIAQPYVATSDPAAVSSVGCYNAGAGGDSNGFVALYVDGYGFKATSINEERGHAHFVPYSANPATIDDGALWVVDGPGVNSRLMIGAAAATGETMHSSTGGSFGRSTVVAHAPGGAFVATGSAVATVAVVALSAEEGPSAVDNAVIEASGEWGAASGVAPAGFTIRIWDVTADPTKAGTPLFERTGLVMYQVGPQFERHFTFRDIYSMPAAGTRTFHFDIETFDGAGTGVQLRDVCFGVRPFR